MIVSLSRIIASAILCLDPRGLPCGLPEESHLPSGARSTVLAFCFTSLSYCFGCVQLRVQLPYNPVLLPCSCVAATPL